MNKFVEGIEAIYDFEISFQKLCDTVDNSFKRYEQLMNKKLGENKEVE